jgi:hypothetical protein
LGESRRIFRRRKTYRAKQNGPGCPEPLKSMGCSTLSKDSVGWRVDACQVTGRLSLHFLPELVSTRTYSPRRMDLTGFEPASATWIECRVAVTPQARIALSGIKAPTAKTCRYKLTVMFSKRNLREFKFADLPGLSSLNQPVAFRTPSAAPTVDSARECSSDMARCASHRISPSRATTSQGPSAPCRLCRRGASLRVSEFLKKNIFARAPRISATHAARRCQRFFDFAHRETFFVSAGFAATIGEIQ